VHRKQHLTRAAIAMPTTKRPTKTKRQRRSPDVVRNAALDAARKLLLRSGPEAITLPAVAKELGMTHGNVTHHFGSVGALHASLVDQMADELTQAVNSAVVQLRAEEADPIKVVDALFDAFSKNDAGRLISWLASTGSMAALEPLFSTVARIVRELSRGAPKPGEERELSVRQNALVLIATALGNALIGDRLHEAVGLPAGELNKLSAKDLVRRAYPAKK
jgi:TetR/AcrR family transcriptional regulator, repressor for neighboring sulfatase